jgi:hypothetical protein
MTNCSISPEKTPRHILFIAIGMIFTAFAIMAYGTYRCRTPAFEDPLTQCALKHPWNRFVDGWGLIHFWFYAMVAYFFPACWKEITFFGILWEVLEMMFKEHPFYLAKCDAQIEQQKGGWWYGRWEDIVMNTLGVMFGVYLAQRAVPKSIFPIGFVVLTVYQVWLQQINT